MLPVALLVALVVPSADRPLAAFGRHPLHVGPSAVAVSADGKQVVALSPTGLLRTLTAADGREVGREALPVADGEPVLSADGAVAAVLAPKATGVDVALGAAGKQWAALEERRGAVESLAVAGDGQALAAAFRLDAGVTRLRLARAGDSLPRPVAQVGGHAHALALSQNADWLLVLAREQPGEKNLLAVRACQLFDVSTGQPLWSRDEPFRHAAISADDRYAVLTGGTGKHANRVLDLADGEPARDRTPPPFAVLGPPLVSADAQTLFAATADGVVAWDLAAGRERFRLPVKGVESPTRRLALSKDGRLLVTNLDGLRAWDAATGQPRWGPAASPAHAAAVRAVRFHPGGREVASLAADGSFVRWDVATGRVVERQTGLPGDDLRFGPRGWQVVACANGAPRLTAVRTRIPVPAPAWQRQLPPGEFRHVASYLSADGETATSILSSVLKVQVVQFTWKTATGETHAREEVPSGRVGGWTVDVSPDARWRVKGTGLDHGPAGGPWESPTDTVQLHRSLGNALTPPVFTTDRLVAANLSPVGGFGSLAAAPITGPPADAYQCLVLELASARPVLDAEVSGGRWHVVTPDDRYLGVVRARELSLTSLLLPAGPPVVLPIGPASRPAAVAFSPEGGLLAVGQQDGAIELWSVPRPDVPALADAKTAWDRLEGEPRAARLLIEQLVRSPAAVDLLAAKLPTAPPPRVDSIPAVVAKLDAPAFADRDAAVRTLRALGSRAKADLETVAKKTESVELRQRAEDLLKAIATASRWAPTPDVVRGIRAVEVLERTGSPAAVKVLHALTVQVRDPRLADEASAALARLKLRDTPP